MLAVHDTEELIEKSNAMASASLLDGGSTGFKTRFLDLVSATCKECDQRSAPWRGYY